MTDSHLINTLINFYLDKNHINVYHGRWDTWLITKNLMQEYLYLMMKTDLQLANILRQAYTQAGEIKNSPLGKAMNEDT